MNVFSFMNSIFHLQKYEGITNLLSSSKILCIRNFLLNVMLITSKYHFFRKFYDFSLEASFSSEISTRVINDLFASNFRPSKMYLFTQIIYSLAPDFFFARNLPFHLNNYKR